MNLYTTDISPNCRRVEATLHHLGLYDEIEIVRLNLIAGEHQQDDGLRAANPNCKVPTLVVADMNLWESNPTMIYLSDRAGAEDFCPADPKTRFEILRWMSWELQHYNRALGDILWETIAKAKFGMGEADQAVIDAQMENFRRFAAILDARLAGTAFLLGDKVTVTDFSVGGPSALALHPHSQVPLDDYPNVKAWYRRLETVPAWAATAPKALAEAA